MATYHGYNPDVVEVGDRYQGVGFAPGTRRVLVYGPVRRTWREAISALKHTIDAVERKQRTEEAAV